MISILIHFISEFTRSTSNPVSDNMINVENNVILTTKDEINVQQIFNYLTKNLDRFRSEFIVVYGIHGGEEGEEGELMEGDEDFRYEYEMLFNWFKNRTKYNHQVQVVEDRQYSGTIVEVNSVEHESEEGKYMFDETNGISSTSERTI